MRDGLNGALLTLLRDPPLPTPPPDPDTVFMRPSTPQSYPVGRADAAVVDARNRWREAGREQGRRSGFPCRAPAPMSEALPSASLDD